MKKVFAGKNTLCYGNNMRLLNKIEDATIDLIYIDPPFNTGKLMKRDNYTSTKNDEGYTLGFSGQNYDLTKISSNSYNDKFENFTDFLKPRLIESYRVLKPNGALYLHIDYREVHYTKILLDEIFGRASFINEIIWAYDFGARAKKRWPAKHDNILFYAKDPKAFVFNTELLDREPYLAPGLVTPQKAALGKLPTDVWWHTIVSPTGKEKTGYPTQKPEAILRRIINASSNPGDMVLDFFAGSGTTGAVAAKLGRNFILGDDNTQSIGIIKDRLSTIQPSVKYKYYEV
jgi:site-specific DNA-methyltransferase (adenine-specific)